MDAIADSARSVDQHTEDVGRLKEWLCKQPHLPHDLDDELLTAFVCGTKSVEKAKRRLDAFLTFRGKVPSMFSFKNRDPLDPAFLKSCQALKVFYLPETTQEGYRVMCILPHLDFSQFNHQWFESRWMMLTEIAAVTWPDMSGMVMLMDMKTVDSSIIMKFSLSCNATAMHWVQNTMPIKFKKAIFINTPPFTDTLFTMIKPLLKSKILDRMTFTSKGAEVLKDYIQVDILPKEYGGQKLSAEDLNNEALTLLFQRRDWLANTSQLRSNESLRPPDSCDSYGVDGTFKYLQID